jgi:FlaA1/EpsC-like NDP-sugar epimerase
MFLERLKQRNFWLMVGADALLVVVCFYLAYLIRFEFIIPAGHALRFYNLLPWVIAIKLASFIFFGLYRGMWRYTGLVDLSNVGKAVFTSSALIVVAILMIHRFQGTSRSVFLIDAVLTFLAVSGLRVAIRLYYGWGSDGVSVLFPHFWTGSNGGKRLLIIGAGNAGEKVLREIRDNPALKINPVGFVDDDLGKQGKAIHGVPILGPVEAINDLSIEFDEILIAISSAKGPQMRRIVQLCESTGLRYRTVPGIGELIGGTVSLMAIREVDVADLLGRREVHLDQEGIAGYLHGKRVLVTGAGGSIGSELVRQVCRFKPETLGLLDNSEFNLFRVEMDCRQIFSTVETREFLADVRSREAVLRVFREFRPHVVFHAAAYKHVPMQETHPWEAVTNNILGTRITAEAALETGVDRFVLVSSDKAVRPTNVMGATKRVAEMLVGCMEGHGPTRFMAVRFGNVVGSSGSVIPIFKEQIARGGPVTVTHPDVIRYFMSVPEAAQLIIQAGAMGQGGEIFILDMGEPIRVLDVANDLIRLHGWEPGRDIAIEFIGLRPGEKLYEELITEGEGIVNTDHDKIMVLRGETCELEWVHAKMDDILRVAAEFDAEEIKAKLRELVPEYSAQGNSNMSSG